MAIRAEHPAPPVAIQEQDVMRRGPKKWEIFIRPSRARARVNVGGPPGEKQRLSGSPSHQFHQLCSDEVLTANIGGHDEQPRLPDGADVGAEPAEANEGVGDEEEQRAGDERLINALAQQWAQMIGGERHSRNDEAVDHHRRS